MLWSGFSFSLNSYKLKNERNNWRPVNVQLPKDSPNIVALNFIMNKLVVQMVVVVMIAINSCFTELTPALVSQRQVTYSIKQVLLCSPSELFSFSLVN
jgi:hypothetical protein